MSAIPRLNSRSRASEIHRGFAVFQLMTILDKAHHSLIFIEHDPLLYENAAEYASLALREAAKEADVLLYAPGADPYFEELIRNADRVFYFNEGPRAEMRIAAKVSPRAQRSQTTLAAFA